MAGLNSVWVLSSALISTTALPPSSAVTDCQVSHAERIRRAWYQLLEAKLEYPSLPASIRNNVKLLAAFAVFPRKKDSRKRAFLQKRSLKWVLGGTVECSVSHVSVPDKVGHHAAPNR